MRIIIIYNYNWWLVGRLVGGQVWCRHKSTTHSWPSPMGIMSQHPSPIMNGTLINIFEKCNNGSKNKDRMHVYIYIYIYLLNLVGRLRCWAHLCCLLLFASAFLYASMSIFNFGNTQIKSCAQHKTYISHISATWILPERLLRRRILHQRTHRSSGRRRHRVAPPFIPTWRNKTRIPPCAVSWSNIIMMILPIVVVIITCCRVSFMMY